MEYHLMRAAVATLFACSLVAPVSSIEINEVSMESSLSFDAEGARTRPVTKVITLLKDMLTQMGKDAIEDEKLYDKMACWCETNDKQYVKLVADEDSRISDLTTQVEGLTATSSGLKIEVENLKKETGESQSALDKSTAIRTKMLAEFNSGEKGYLESISSLGSAVTAMSNKGSLLQMPRIQVDVIAASVKTAMQKHSSALAGVLTHTERRALSAFLQAPGGAYAPQGGQIFGILGQMKETFETNLATSQKEESSSQKSYQDLKTAKEAEIAAGSEQRDTKMQRLADTDEKNAQAKEDLESTKKSLAADESFLGMLRQKCALNDKEWGESQKSRATEVEACNKALAVLSSDDAQTLGFVQKESIVNSERRTQASKLLSAVADKLQNPRLATLAVKMRLDAFGKVKKAVDDMVGALVQEKADEIKLNDFCVDEFNKNELETEKKARAKADIISAIDDLESRVSAGAASLKGTIDKLNAEISKNQMEIKIAGEEREKQNRAFQTVVADQRATQKLLTQALDVLKGVYSSGQHALNSPALVQAEDEQGAAPEPPKGLEKYKRNGAGGGVLGMLQQIIQDAKSVEVEAIRDEEDAQKAYQSLVKAATASIATKNKDLINKSANKAHGETDLVEANQNKAAILLEAEQLVTAKAELHKRCDYVVKNFEMRQSARDEEVEALKQAKAILSGSKFAAFLSNN